MARKKMSDEEKRTAKAKREEAKELAEASELANRPTAAEVTKVPVLVKKHDVRKVGIEREDSGVDLLIDVMMRDKARNAYSICYECVGEATVGDIEKMAGEMGVKCYRGLVKQ